LGTCDGALGDPLCGHRHVNSRGPCGQALVRYPGEGVDLAEFPGDFVPGIASIAAAEDLAVDAAGQQKIGVGSVRGQVPDRPVGGHRYRQGLPGLPPVTRAVQRSQATEGALSVAQVDHLGIIRLDEHAPAVRDGHLAPDLHRLPGGAVIGAGEDFPWCDGQQRLRRPDRDRQVMDVRVGDTARYSLPRIAAVLAVPYAVYFEAGPDVLMVDRVNHQGGDPRDAHIGTLLGYLHGQLAPMPAAVRGAEQRCRPGARKDDVGVDRVNSEGPDGDLVHGRVQPLPVLAFILTAVYAAVRATVHDTSVAGMHRQSAHGAFAIEAVADPQPGVSAIAAAPDALSKGAYTDSGLFRHCFSPSATTFTRKLPGPFSPPHQSAQRGSPQAWWHGTSGYG